MVGAAAALPGPEPAALPTLRELLAHATASPAQSTRTPGALRARLAGSATVPILAPNAPSRPGSALAATLRRATGPPRR